MYTQSQPYPQNAIELVYRDRQSLLEMVARGILQVYEVGQYNAIIAYDSSVQSWDDAESWDVIAIAPAGQVPVIGRYILPE